MKRLFYLLIILGLAWGIYAFQNEKKLDDFCAFCDPTILSKQMFYEDSLVYALYTHKPILPGHCLIIPKRHVERFEELSDDEILAIGRTIKKVNIAVMQVFETSSYLLLQKNGVEVGQTVPHVHVHYIPRKKGEDSILSFLIKMYTSSIQSPISQEEMDRVVKELKAAISPSKNAALTPLSTESSERKGL
jgi:diadenosine tetraphosphate (Ap4A) HIT family hydrolase